MVGDMCVLLNKCYLLTVSPDISKTLLILLIMRYLHLGFNFSY